MSDDNSGEACKRRRIDRNASQGVASSLGNGRMRPSVSASRLDGNSERDFLKRSLTSTQETVRCLMNQNENLSEENRRLKQRFVEFEFLRKEVETLRNMANPSSDQNQRPRTRPTENNPVPSTSAARLCDNLVTKRRNDRVEEIRRTRTEEQQIPRQSQSTENAAAFDQQTPADREVRNTPNTRDNVPSAQQRRSVRSKSTSPFRINTPEIRRPPRDSLSTPVIRNAELTERLKELEKENLELRRRIVGLTPQAPAPPSSQNNNGSCPRCRQLERQKSHQAEYFEGKLVESRESAADYRKQCETLASALQCMESHLISIQQKFKEQMRKAKELADMYKGRSNRLARWRSSEMKGLQSDVGLIKDKMNGVEKQLVKTQLDLLSLNQYDVIYEELGRLMTETKTAGATLDSLRDTIQIRENLPKLYI